MCCSWHWWETYRVICHKRVRYEIYMDRIQFLVSTVSIIVFIMICTLCINWDIQDGKIYHWITRKGSISLGEYTTGFWGGHMGDHFFHWVKGAELSEAHGGWDPFFQDGSNFFAHSVQFNSSHMDCYFFSVTQFLTMTYSYQYIFPSNAALHSWIIHN